MFSFAALRYRDVLIADGGPVFRISTRKLNENTQSSADGQFEAYAYLGEHLKLVRPWIPKLYGVADGTGTDPNRMIAIHKSISEAIERWAFLATYTSGFREKYGFHLDSSTLGMAAFPSFFHAQVRRKALAEAIERWSLSAWWEGRLCHETMEHEVLGRRRTTVSLQSPWPGYSIVIHHQRSLKAGLGAYGFACDADFKKASLHAEVELLRNERTLDLSFGSLKAPDLVGLGLIERRLLFFSSEPGIAYFRKRLERNYGSLISSVPHTLVDAEIPGPWSKYAHVWRCLFEPTSNEFKGGQPDYFLF